MSFSKSNMKKYLPAVVAFLVAAVSGFLIAVLVLNRDGGSMSFGEFIGKFVWLLVCLFVSVFIHVIAHEAGHMVAALMRGWRFGSFMIMGVVLSRRDGRWQLSRFSMPGAGGQCLMLPPEGGDTPGGIAFYNAGGVLANGLLVIAASIPLLVSFSSLPFLLMSFLVGMVLVGVFLVLLNGIPLTVNGLPNDGMNLLKLHKDAFATEVFLRTMRIMGLLMQGKNRELDNYPYICDERPLDFSNALHVMALASDISLALMRMDFDKARAILQRIEPEWEKVVPVYQNELSMEAVYLTLMAPHQPSDIDCLLTPFFVKYLRMQAAFRPTALRVQYALALLHEHDEAKANECYGRFQKVCRHYYIRGDVEIERRLVEEVRQHQSAP